MSFQNRVNIQPAPAVAGDFASANPRATVLSGAGSLVTGVGGALVALFAWAVAGVVTNAGSGAPTGFIARAQQALITAFLGESGNTIPDGLGITLYSQGDFWVQTLTVATIGQKVFASNTTGVVNTGTAGATIAGFTETKWSVGSAGAANELIKITTWG